ncbi:hypothetical protein [Victivallis sp. Marseille-Q1083]|uniref:hypothetical protein n=1 Tax=Victivallis sp. Marseille-Q1083 TaxID=2717288 RepID=UPI00158994E5|nr:hypothetical protein [Victivallis sp. Marseille-Q1083]
MEKILVVIFIICGMLSGCMTKDLPAREIATTANVIDTPPYDIFSLNWGDSPEAVLEKYQTAYPMNQKPDGIYTVKEVNGLAFSMVFFFDSGLNAIVLRKWYNRENLVEAFYEFREIDMALQKKYPQSFNYFQPIFQSDIAFRTNLDRFNFQGNAAQLFWSADSTNQIEMFKNGTVSFDNCFTLKNAMLLTGLEHSYEKDFSAVFVIAYEPKVEKQKQLQNIDL